MKIITFLLYCMLLMTVCFDVLAQEYTIRVRGKVRFVENKFEMSAYQSEGTGKKILARTQVLPDKSYSLEVKLDKPGVVTIDCGRWQTVDVWVEDEDLDVDFRGVDTARIKIKNPPYVYIKGGPKNEVMNLINYEAYRNYQCIIGVAQSVYRAKIEDKEKSNVLSAALYGVCSQNYREHMRFFARHYADRSSVMAVLGRLDPEEDAELIESSLNRMESANGSIGVRLADDLRKEMKETIAQKQRMKVGMEAPLFSLPDKDGILHHLSDYRGKVVVLDFWASWCGPCRKEIPNLKKAYDELVKTGEVAFISVSIDDKPASWQKAVNEEKMPWLQLLAPNAGKDIMQQYQFSGIPFILVIDKDGKIYEKNLRGERISQSVRDALSGKVKDTKGKNSIVRMGVMM